jgi:hypothetical protein
LPQQAWKLQHAATAIYCGSIIEAHQGVMADRRHSLKRGDRLSKKERQTTASDWKKSDKLRFMLWVKSDSDMYKFITIKQVTKQLQNE